MIEIGFTGTSTGPLQWEQCRTTFTWLAYLRKKHGGARVHHGDCIEADARIHRQARAMGIPRVIHPPDNDSKRAFAHRDDNEWTGAVAKTTILAPLPYLDRNKNIVDRTGILIAHPGGPEIQRSGTWSTVRYARRIGRWIIIVWPDGTWEETKARLDVD